MAKPDSARGRYGAWIRRNRKNLFGNNLAGLTARLAAEGVAGEAETIRGWEAGANPSPDAVAALERIFGELAPDGAAADSDLAAAIREQTAALDRLVAALERDRVEGPPWAEALARILGANLQAPHSEASGERRGSAVPQRDRA